LCRLNITLQLLPAPLEETVSQFTYPFQGWTLFTFLLLLFLSFLSFYLCFAFQLQDLVLQKSSDVENFLKWLFHPVLGLLTSLSPLGLVRSFWRSALLHHSASQ
jgi:uncharacterized protein YggT (Ycf19 family)